MLVPLMNATFMRQITLQRAGMTTRKSPQVAACARLAPLALGAGVLALVLGGCATPGNLHIYSLALSNPSEVRNTAATGAGRAEERDVPSFVGDDTLTGFAYDPFTDHFFLRVAPGNQLRVVDRPDRSIKREFTVAQMPTTGGGDLAVKPRSGHLFLVHPSEPALIELTRLGEFVGVIRLADTSAPPAGVAYDAVSDTLLVLNMDAGARQQVATHTLAGQRVAVVTLEREVIGSLAFDVEARELYAPLAPAGAGLGVFDEQGKLKRALPSEAAFVDVGPRSLLRLF